MAPGGKHAFDGDRRSRRPRGFRLISRRLCSVFLLRCGAFRVLRDRLLGILSSFRRHTRKRQVAPMPAPAVVQRNKTFVMRRHSRSNSFYAEAIGDCLEFIRSNSTLSSSRVGGDISVCTCGSSPAMSTASPSIDGSDHDRLKLQAGAGKLVPAA